MRATKEIFRSLRLGIKQRVIVNDKEKTEYENFETLQKRVHDLEAEKQELNHEINDLKQRVQSQSGVTDLIVSDAVSHCLDELIECADCFGENTIQGLFNVLNCYGLKHNHVCDNQIQTLYAKLADKWKRQIIIHEMNVKGDVFGDNAIKQVNNYN